jgi:hypothetical protein
MKEKWKSKLWTRAIKHLSREADEYAKLHGTLANILRVTSLRAQYADEAGKEEVLCLAIQPPLQFARWRQETAQVKKHTEALARLLLGRDKSKWPEAKPSGSRDDDDIPF